MAIFIINNNYFHDLATALLVCSAIVIFIVLREAEKQGGDAMHFFLSIYPKLTKIARYSLVWIIVGGAIRAAFYRQYEWSDAAARNQIAYLFVKHAIIFTTVSIGIYLWIKLSKKVRNLKEQYGHNADEEKQSNSMGDKSSLQI
jgi:large-conductance mechanosensitive channel